MKIRSDDSGKSVLKEASKTIERTAEKILKLETPLEVGEDNEVIKFHREFDITQDVINFKSKRDEWYLKLTSNKEKFKRYLNRLADLAEFAGFKRLEDKFGVDQGREIDTLEEYLITGEIIGQKNSTEATEDASKHHINREWETATLARRIRDKLDSGKNYQEIAECYNKRKPSDAPKVTTAKLRQIISRANKKLGRKITKS